MGKKIAVGMVAGGYSLGFWLAVVSAFGFSFKAILVKLAYAVPQQVPVDAVTLLTLRMLFALPFFLLLFWSSEQSGQKMRCKDFAGVIVLGVIGYYGASLFDFWGLNYVSVGLERLILFSFPLLTLFFDAVLRGRKIRGYEWLAVVICYSGIALAFYHDMGFADLRVEVWFGSGLIFLSALCYALYLSGGRPLIVRYGSFRFASLALIVSTVATLTHFVVSHPLSVLIQPWKIYLLAFVMGVFSTFIPVLALAAAVRRIGSSHAALVSSLGPVLTIFFGWLMLSEAVSLMQMGGTLLVIVGILLVSEKGRREAG